MASCQRSVKREVISHLGTLDFVVGKENVIFLGPPGTGKTHLATGLGIRACQAGHRVAFATAAQWVTRLAEAHTAGRLTDELTRLGRIPLIVVDEVGYIPFEPEAANLFFQFISGRYERAPDLAHNSSVADRLNREPRPSLAATRSGPTVNPSAARLRCRRRRSRSVLPQRVECLRGRPARPVPSTASHPCLRSRDCGRCRAYGYRTPTSGSSARKGRASKSGRRGSRSPRRTLTPGRLATLANLGLNWAAA
ncbi:ATP-binding protein [Streptomyces sp. NPDC017964]|uniref:ATP-binding protein n=1 Tax=Streptomyces sp. NPDC017964 TaxID=3365022 RepID=UPI0037A4C3D2